MAVEKEQFAPNDLIPDGKSLPDLVSLVRNPAGDWSLLFRIDGAYQLPDGRIVRVDRHVRIKATEQLGRRQRQAVPA